MKTMGVLLLAAGGVALWVFGRNYGLCHQWWIDPSQPACRAASSYHGWGIGLLILGGLALVAGVARGARARKVEESRPNG